MSLEKPTRAELLAELLANFLALEPQASSSPDTLEGARLLALVEALYGIYHHVDYIETRVMFPSPGMDPAALELHAEARLGPGARKGATISQGVDALRVAGVVGTTFAAGLTLSHTDGTRYLLSEGGTVGGGGTVDVSVESISKGAAVNKVTGDTLTFESPPAGITAAAALVADLSGGLDQESDAALLGRVLDAYRNPPAGGRASDYRQWAGSVTGVDQSFVYCPSSGATTGRRGMGVVDVAVLAPGSGSARVPSAGVVLAVQDYLDEVRPCTTKDVLAVTPAAVAQDIEVQVSAETGYEFDWVGAGVVAGWVAGTLTVTWGAALPTDLTALVDAGQNPRIVIRGELMSIASYAEPAHETVLTAAPVVTPVAADAIYPGGPLTEPVREAIIAYVDTLGPARGTAYDPEQEWEDTLRISKLYSTMLARALDDGTQVGVGGVKDAVVAVPAANVTPVDHAPGGTVDLVVYGTITVRPL